MKKETRLFKFHTDSGHGWLEVSIQDMESVAFRASRYSYKDAKNFYLEEDCDAGSFLKEFSKTFDIAPEIEYLPQVNGDHFIRSLCRAVA